MGYDFRIHTGAVSQLEKLPGGVDERILNKLEEMVTNEYRDLRDYDVRKLRGTKTDIYRARIGSYRVFFLLEEDLVAILNVDDREGAYNAPETLDQRADDF